MRTLGAVLDDKAARAEAKRQRHRVWHWCRLKNGFSDQPLWRVVAARLNLPVYQVVAFVTRLEEHANAASPRGYVGDASPAVFGAALGMSAEEASRIFAELADRAIGWIDQEHVVSFYERNKDDETEDATAPLRARRSRARRALRISLERLVDDAMLEQADAGAVVADLEHMADEELFELEQRRRNGQLAGHLLSTGRASRRDAESSRVTNVTRHTRADAAEQRTLPAVDKFSDTTAAAPRGDTAGSAKEGSGATSSPEPNVWLATQGKRVVLERMGLMPAQAELRIERWLRDVDQDAMALALAIDAADQATKTAAAFHVEVVAQIDRWRRDSADQRRLPLVQRLTGKLGGAA